MALKVLMLRKKIGEKQAALTELRKAAEGFETREAELEKSIEEAVTDEEKAIVEAAVGEFETEKSDNAAKQTGLQEEIAAAEGEIKEIEDAEPKGGGEGRTARKGQKHMETRVKFFGLDAQERDALFAREDVKAFLQRTRELGREKRAVTGADLLIPDVMLELVRENVDKHSKLLSRVSLRKVPGTARQTIMGTIPEAVWTEMLASINELELTFNQVETDGYMVAGFIAIPNPTLEDSDIALATEIISALGQALGYALDKAILYGTGIKMPLGYVVRLAQDAKPSNYPAAARPWADLRTSNLVTVNAANSIGTKLFQSIVRASGAAKGKYSTGGKFWCMNDTTFTELMAEAMSINAAGAIVSGQMGTMPVIGGDIVTLDFVPDNNIVGGYGDLYILAERAGTAIAQSEHVRFLQNQTVFKGTARYDGLPAIAEGFVAIGIKDTAPSTSVPFAPDEANANPNTPSVVSVVSDATEGANGAKVRTVKAKA